MTAGLPVLRQRTAARRVAMTGAQVRLGIGILLLIIFVAGPYLRAQSPFTTSGDILAPPSAQHLFGTDQLGRDVLSRTLAGGQLLTLMSLAAGALSVVLGSAIGMLAGYKGGWIGAVLMRLVDLLLAFPPLVVILVLLTVFPRGVLMPTILTAVLLTPTAARIIQGLTQELASREFVAAAEAAGVGSLAILWGELLPNLRSRLILELALRTGFAVLLVSALNFLGVGLQPPSPDWGVAVNEGSQYLMTAPWAALFPALGIFLLVASVNVIASALDRMVESRSRAPHE